MSVPKLINGYSALTEITGRSRVQLYRDVKEGKFPAPLELGANSVAWVESEVMAWIASRPRRTYRADVPQAQVAA